MKKVFLFILVLGVLSVMSFGMTGTGAWFTSVKELTGSSISSGNVELGAEGSPFGANLLVPGGGWRDIGWFCVTNNGSYDMKWRGWFYNVDDPKNLRDYLQIRITLNPTDHQGNYGKLDTILYEEILFTDLMSKTNTKLILDTSTVTPGDPAFAPQAKVCYGLQSRLSHEAGNAQQNGTLTAKLYLFGTQWNASW
jgi:hypothetical protein